MVLRHTSDIGKEIERARERMNNLYHKYMREDITFSALQEGIHTETTRIHTLDWVLGYVDHIDGTNTEETD